MKERNYCITISAEKIDWNTLKDVWNDDTLRYMLIGYEVSKTGYEHYQIYVQLWKQHRRKGLKKIFSCDSLHAESQKGTNEQARNYCWKGQFEKKGTEYPQPSAIIMEFGTFCKGQGSRTEIDQIKQDIDDGMDHFEIVQDMKKFSSYARYHSWFYKYKQMVDDRKYNMIRDPVKTNVIYGDCATGKTTAVLKKEGVENCYILKNPNGDNKNWNGYENQTVLVIDDFYGWMPVNEMLRIMDNKPYRVRKLGSYTWARWSKIYITSNTGPREWYKSIPQEVENALMSRLTKCLKVTRGNTGALVVRMKSLPCRDRNSHKEYLDLDSFNDSESEMSDESSDDSF